MEIVIKATKEPIMAMREADTPFSNARLVNAVPRSGGPALKQPTVDIYQELCNFEIVAKNILPNRYNTQGKQESPNNIELVGPKGTKVCADSK